MQASGVVVPTTSDPDALSFTILVEALALSAFRQTGVPMQRVRRALDYASDEIDATHLLASRQLLTDGLDLFYGFEERTGESVGLLNISRGGRRRSP